VSVDGGHTTTMSLDAVRHWPLLLEALRDRVGGKRIVSVGQVAIYFPIVRFFDIGAANHHAANYPLGTLLAF
jgi:hypothetical protein